MDSKAVTGIAAACIAVGFFIGTVAENARMMAEIRATPPVVNTTTDTLWQQGDPVYMPGVPGVIDTLRDTLYAFEPNPDVVARMDTVLPPRGDALGVTYHLPPVNKFDLAWIPAPNMTTHETTTNTVTVVERRFFLGPYAKMQVFAPWSQPLIASGMRFEGGLGLSLQVGKWQLDIEPLDIDIVDSKFDAGLSLGVRYYPWAN
jgi:hypothetical protein